MWAEPPQYWQERGNLSSNSQKSEVIYTENELVFSQTGLLEFKS